MLTTGYQLVAARALIGMDQTTLASLAKVSANTIRNMEASKEGPIAGRSQNVQAVQAALEATGIEFIGGDEPGVKLRKRKGKRK
jgi:transcriptional regulator with XRE-family HTH domain